MMCSRCWRKESTKHRQCEAHASIPPVGNFRNHERKNIYSGFRSASHRRKREKERQERARRRVMHIVRGDVGKKEKTTTKAAKERPSGILPYSAFAFRPENRCPCKPMRTQDVGAYRLGSYVKSELIFTGGRNR